MTSVDLQHDVGKYIARTALNLRDPVQEVPEVLVGMLVRDLYELDGERRASEVFEGGLETLAEDRRARLDLERLRACFSAIDALEPRVRRGEVDALVEARDLALEVRELLNSGAERR